MKKHEATSLHVCPQFLWLLSFRDGLKDGVCSFSPGFAKCQWLVAIWCRPLAHFPLPGGRWSGDSGSSSGLCTSSSTMSRQTAPCCSFCFRCRKTNWNEHGSSLAPAFRITVSHLKLILHSVKQLEIALKPFRFSSKGYKTNINKRFFQGA